jgi:CBS domain-containing protein
VVDTENRLLGIVSRHDLVRVFARPDGEISDEIYQDVVQHALCIDPLTLNVRVSGGVVTLRGQVQRRSLVPVVGTMCHQVNGVVDVVNELSYAVDDSNQNIGIIHPFGDVDFRLVAQPPAQRDDAVGHTDRHRTRGAHST